MKRVPVIIFVGFLALGTFVIPKLAEADFYDDLLKSNPLPAVSKIGEVSSQAAVPTNNLLENLVEHVINPLARAAARTLVNQIISDTIDWANSGFDGNPAYVTDPDRYFGKLGSGVVGDFINDSKLGFLCSPFQAQVKLSLVKQYTEDYQPQCTLEEIGVNLDNFYEDFDEGGWEGFIEMTQEQSNNPYGAFVKAKFETDSRIANLLAIKQMEYSANTGFLNFRKCLKKNVEPPASVVKAHNDANWEQRIAIRAQYPDWTPGKDNGACILQGAVQTPGATIKTQIDHVLPKQLEQLVSAEQWDQVIVAFASGVLQKFIFNKNEKGLFRDDYRADTPTPVPPPPTPPGTGTPPQPTLSCSPSEDMIRRNEDFTWNMQSTYPEGTIYQWIGTDIDAEPTDSPEDLLISYSSIGEKTASIEVTPEDEDARTIACSGSVFVTSSNSEVQ